MFSFISIGDLPDYINMYYFFIINNAAVNENDKLNEFFLKKYKTNNGLSKNL